MAWKRRRFITAVQFFIPHLFRAVNSTCFRLKSTNCVVDGRFTCKITDYGLPRLYDAQNMYDEVQENESSEDLLWGRGRQM
jgi:hypothetical protein